MPLDEEAKAHVAIILKASELLLMLINDILDFSKVTQSNHAPCGFTLLNQVEAGELSLERVPVRLRQALQEAMELERWGFIYRSGFHRSSQHEGHRKRQRYNFGYRRRRTRICDVG